MVKLKAKTKTKSQKGYVLMVVMVFSFLVALTVASCCVVAFRYNRSTRKGIYKHDINYIKEDQSSMVIDGNLFISGEKGELWNFTY